MLKLPKLLNIPPKLYSFITSFNFFLYFLIEGGRGSAKTQSVARFILYICEKRKVRICCGRELQANIDESVKAVLVDLIRLYNLNFIIFDKKIVHRETGSIIFFKGFREQGSVNIKGLEGVDLLWIEEAQSISKPTLDIITPTIRKNNSKIIFTMNRFVRNDPVYKFCTKKDDCLHIKINYFDNPYCPEKLKKEARELKESNYKEYKHIWLGEPLDQANDFLISSSKIEFAKTIIFNPDLNIRKLKVMSVDLSCCGGDLNVAKLIEKASASGWIEAKTEKWSEPDTDVTIGKIINLFSIWKPDILILDADGMGYPIYVSVKKAIPDCIGFRGAGKARLQNTANQRADGYVSVADFLINGWLKLTCENSARQLEYINTKGIGKRVEHIQALIEKMDDPYSGGDGMLPEWYEFFNDTGVSYENAEVNADTELAEKAFNVIVNKEYLKVTDQYHELDKYEKQYYYILDLYKKSQGEQRNYPYIAMYEWLERVNLEFQENFMERFELDTREIERLEHLNKYELAKEKILKNIDKLKMYDKTKEFEYVIKSAFDSVNFLTSSDKQKLLNNFLELKTIEDLKNNIDEIMDISRCMEDLTYRKILDAKIQRELKTSDNIKRGNHKVGRFDYKTNKIFEELRNFNILKQEDAQTELTELSFNEDEALTFEEKLRNKFLYYKANGNIYLTSNFIHSLYEDILSLKLVGKFAKKDIDLTKRLNNENSINELIQIITLNKNTISTKEISKFADIAVLELKKGYVANFGNWESTLNAIFNNDTKEKYSLLNDEAEVQTWSHNEKQNFINEVVETLGLRKNDNLENLGFSNFGFDNKIIEKLSDTYSYVETIKGLNIPKELNKMNLIQIYIWYKNPILNERLKNQFGLMQLNEMFSKLDNEDIKLGDMLQRTASKYYNEANRVYIEKYGIELPKAINYFPSKTDYVSELDMLTEYAQHSTSPNFIKNRNTGTKISMEFSNPVQILFSHIDKMGRFIKMTKKIDNYNLIFKDGRLKRIIQNKLDKDTYKSLIQMLANSSYTKKAQSYDALNGLFNKFFNNWVVTKIAVKPSIFFKQVLSVVNYAEDMPFDKWIVGFTKTLQSPKKTIKFMMNDPYIKARFESGLQSEYLQETINNINFAKTKKLADFFTLSVRLGDVGAIAFGGKPYVDYLIKEKDFSEAEAFEKFRQMTMRSQQASVPSSLSNWQNNINNPFTRTFFAFRNTSNQYLRKAADSFIDYSNGQIGLKQLSKNLFIYTVFNSFLYRTATSLSVIKLLLTGNDDNFIDDIVQSIFDLNAVAVPLIGDIYSYAVAKITGNRASHSTIPALDEIYTMIDKLGKEDFTIDDFVYIINNLIEITSGIPANAFTNMAGGVGDIIGGEYEQGLLRLYGSTKRRAETVTGKR